MAHMLSGKVVNMGIKQGRCDNGQGSWNCAGVVRYCSYAAGTAE